MRTPDGLIFGLPVVMDSDGTEEVGQKVLLKQGDLPIAVMEVEVWGPQCRGSRIFIFAGGRGGAGRAIEPPETGGFGGLN